MQRQLGRCLLRLQQYERLIKGIVATHEISVTSRTPESSLPIQRDAVANDTLGVAVRKLFGSYVYREGDTPVDKEPAYIEGTISFHTKMRLMLRSDDYDLAEQEASTLVQLRNRLVHHFIERHDVWTEKGCSSAIADLSDAYAHIERCMTRLRQWAEWLDDCRGNLAEALASDVFLDAAVLGILPDGTVAWEYAAVVEHLCKAWEAIGQNGWAGVHEAGAWVLSANPRLTPERHGCRNWRHVLSESRRFDIQYFRIDDRRVAHYRPRPDTGKN